jgi:hypothetical protein
VQRRIFIGLYNGAASAAEVIQHGKYGTVFRNCLHTEENCENFSHDSRFFSRDPKRVFPLHKFKSYTATRTCSVSVHVIESVDKSVL